MTGLPDEIRVGDERFAVDVDPDQPGTVHLTWLTGRNEGYGFSTRSSSGRLPDVASLTDGAAGFLDAIDPETGYLAD